jgi:hypothetical protein
MSFDQRAYCKAWRERNADKLKSDNERYYQANKEAIRERSRLAYYADRERKRAVNQKYVAANREKVRATRTKYWHGSRKLLERDKWATVSGRAAKLLRGSRSMARQRGIPYSLTIEHIFAGLESGICAATGIPFVMDDPKSPWRPSIDRIDSAGAYEPDNIQIVAFIYNVSKHDYKPADVLRMAKALVSRSSSCCSSP